MVGHVCWRKVNTNEMKITRLVLLVSACAFVLFAQEYPEFNTWMKKYTGPANDAFKKLDKKTGPQAVRGAEIIASVYENMIPFWREHGAGDAVKWSIEGKAAAVQLASAAHAGDAAKA